MLVPRYVIAIGSLTGDSSSASDSGSGVSADTTGGTSDSLLLV